MGVAFREMITGGRFYYGAELVTTRGIADAQPKSKLVELGNCAGGRPADRLDQRHR